MRKFLSNTKGVAAVEFALTVGLFLFVFFMNFELSRLAITSGYLDLSVAQSVRIARNAQTQNTGGNYEKVFTDTLNKYLGSPEGTFMKFLLHTTSNDLKITVKYTDCESDQKKCIDALLDGKYMQPRKDANGNIISPSGANVTLAYYQLDAYDFKFKTVFPFLPKSWMSNTLNRNFIVVQEYGRTAFPTTFRN